MCDSFVDMATKFILGFDRNEVNWELRGRNNGGVSIDEYCFWILKILVFAQHIPMFNIDLLNSNLTFLVWIINRKIRLGLRWWLSVIRSVVWFNSTSLFFAFEIQQIFLNFQNSNLISLPDYLLLLRNSYSTAFLKNQWKSACYPFFFFFFLFWSGLVAQTAPKK
jgi:hypothetical protein